MLVGGTLQALCRTSRLPSPRTKAEHRGRVTSIPESGRKINRFSVTTATCPRRLSASLPFLSVSRRILYTHCWISVQLAKRIRYDAHKGPYFEVQQTSTRSTLNAAAKGRTRPPDTRYAVERVCRRQRQPQELCGDTKPRGNQWRLISSVAKKHPQHDECLQVATAYIYTANGFTNIMYWSIPGIPCIPCIRFLLFIPEVYVVYCFHCQYNACRCDTTATVDRYFTSCGLYTFCYLDRPTY